MHRKSITSGNVFKNMLEIKEANVSRERSCRHNNSNVCQ